MLDALLFTKTNPLLRSIYPACLWSIKTTRKTAYLTFDDGPIPEVTPFVLDELKKYNAKATFFCIGKNVEKNSAIAGRIISEGHTMGNHTYSHQSGWSMRTADYLRDAERCREVLIPYTGPGRQLFRPPYGKLTPAQYRELKNTYSIVMWDVLSFDFDIPTPAEKVLHNVLQHTGAGSVIVMHDSLKARPKVTFALPEILRQLSNRGYSFESITTHRETD